VGQVSRDLRIIVLPPSSLKNDTNQCIRESCRFLPEPSARVPRSLFEGMDVILIRTVGTCNENPVIFSAKRFRFD
jgi:hypothetical protein